MRWLIRLAGFSLAAALMVLAGAQMGLLSGSRPTDLGVKDGKLKAAPASPNCVNSQAAGGYAAIAPLAVTGDPQVAFENLRKLVEAMPGARIVYGAPGYLYAEFSTRWLGFVDDVEFYLDSKARVIHVRSASRLGHGDLGVNRARVESIRARFAAHAG